MVFPGHQRQNLWKINFVLKICKQLIDRIYIEDFTNLIWIPSILLEIKMMMISQKKKRMIKIPKQKNQVVLLSRLQLKTSILLQLHMKLSQKRKRKV